MNMEITTSIYTLVTFGTLLYFYVKYKFSYWKNRNVIHNEPALFTGYSKKRPHRAEIIGKLYNEAKTHGQEYAGCYFFLSPQFIPVDLELVKCVLHKDFSHFSNHGGYVNVDKDPLTGHLFNLENEKWKNLRAKLTPTFTSGKMKMMFEAMVECTDGLQELLKKSSSSTAPVNIKNILACFTTDIIGSVAFGLDINSMQNPDSEFRKYGSKIFKSTLRRRITITLFNVLPRWLTKNMEIKFFDNETDAFYINMVKDTVAYREENNIYRKDFIHLLIQLKNIGKISDDEDGMIMHQNKTNAHGLTFNEMAAQSFVFFVGGFETSATTMTFALLELAQRQDIQDKVRDEIYTVLNKHGNKVTYDSVMEMQYLQNVMLETLRKHPPVAVLPRVCSKEYHIPNSDLVIEPGTRVYIPVMSIHRDPQYYPDPETFDPDRFNEKNKANRHPFAYLPFGEGPRTCIGLRFGKLQTKLGLCSVLRNYRVTLNEKTELPIKYRPGFVSTVKGGVWLNLEPVP